MVDILILTDNEPGHVLPTFRLARNLQDRGYKICYCGIADVMHLVDEAGLPNKCILQDLFPKGSVGKLRQSNAKKDDHLLAILSGALDDVISEFRPKLMICSYFIALESLLLHYKYGIEQIIYHSILPQLDSSISSLGERTANLAVKTLIELSGEAPDKVIDFITERSKGFANFNDLAMPIRRMNQFMLCPREFTLTHELYGANDLFLGPCIRQAGELEQVATQSILKDLRWKKLIFASMGSQTKEYVKKSTLFFEFIIGAMRHEALKEYHLLLSLGSTTNGNDFGMVPDNVSVLSWVSQVELLKHVSLAVVHGGLGSIKECIYFRIPMIIFPMGRDQMDNGVRAQKKQVGLVENIENVTIEKFVSHVESILNRDSLKEGISRMSAIFHDSENQQRDVVFIDNIFRK